jgi:hypothetical protein
LAKIDADLLSTNKRVITIGLELTGARTRALVEDGGRATVRARGERFSDGRFI